MSLPDRAEATQPHESKGKTREEYLIRREDQLLSILGNSYKSVNRSVTLSYGLAAIVLLVRLQLVKALNVSGLNLPLDLHEVMTAAPVGLLLITMFTDYRW